MHGKHELSIAVVWMVALAGGVGCGDDSVGAASGSETGGAAGVSAGAVDTGDADAGQDSSGDGDDGSVGASSGAGDGDGDPSGGSGDGDGDGEGNGGDTDPSGSCGDGVVDPNEACDAGPDNGPDQACLSDCSLNVCGDGFVGPQEGCDDGNLDDLDGCSDACVIEQLPPGALLCNGTKLFACGDTLDNDMDGLVDLDDPECTSPCDDDEATFKTSLPGQNKDCKGDCYFDSNSGSGDDGCQWHLGCDPLSPGAQIGCPHDPELAACEAAIPDSCTDQCSAPLVPNGCDCFGCCEVQGQHIYLDGADCSMANLEECQPCTFNEACPNPCDADACEVCFGQDPDELPPECAEPSCPEGITPCFDESDCAVGQFCQTGCCA